MQETAEFSLDTETIIEEQPLAYRMLIGILKRGSVSPAYLFAGTEGLGKLAMARWFSRAQLCSHPRAAGEPCGSCSVCLQVKEGVHPDVHLIEPTSGAASISIDQVRDEIRPAVTRRTYQGQGKIIAVPQAHLLTVQAQNALLKTLEDPQGESVLILISSQPDSLLPTVRSRCVIIPFKSLSLEAFSRRMQQLGLKNSEHQRELYVTTAGNVKLASELIEKEAGHWALMKKVADRLVRGRLSPPAISDVASRLGNNREDNRRALTHLLVLLRKRMVEQGRWQEFSACVDAVSSAVEAIDANANLRLTLEVCLLQLQAGLRQKYN